MRPWIPGMAAVLMAVAAPAVAQVATIDPGMTRAEVVERLGKPIGERASGQYLYLFYRNNCEVRCGMQDLVILQNDLVVDAIFRSDRRSYSGASSSPTGVTPEASGAGGVRASGATRSAPARTTGSGGLVTGGTTSTGNETPGATTPAPRPGGATVTGATVTGATVTGTGTGSTRAAPTTRPAVTGVMDVPAASRPATPARGIDTSKVLDNVPLNPRDTNTIQPSRKQGQLTPSSPQQQPGPYTGSKPNPRDSAVKAKTGQKPDTVKPPRD